MAQIWNNTTSIKDINEGSTANDGTGDSIRDAFRYVDENFSNISSFLNGAGEYSAGPAFSTLTVANLTSTVSNIGNLTLGNINSATSFYGNINIAANIVPTADGQYDLGSASRPFRNLYVQTTVSTTQIAASSDAGLLLVHANTSPGDEKDVGIIGNVSNHFSSNMYAFFGYQATTNNFVYKITPNNAATIGNSVVYDGVYGNVQFGALLLSNTTNATSNVTGALIVAGGISSNADIRARGNIWSGGFRTLTTSDITSLEYDAYTGSGSLFLGNTIFTAATPSTSTVTGAVVLLGGMGVAGNIVAGGYLGNFWGNITNPTQTNITSVGSLGNLTVIGTTSSGSLQATSGAFTGVLSTTVATQSLNASSLLTAATINAGTIGNTGASIVGTTITGGSFKFSNGAPYITLTIANSTEISANISRGENVGLSLVNSGVTAGNYGSATVVPTVVVDAKGRVTSITTNTVSTTMTLSGNTGSGSLSNGGTLTVAGNGGITTLAQGSKFIITNSGVTSIVAGTDITVSGATGAVTVNDASTLATVTGRGATTTSNVIISGGLNVGTALLPSGGNAIVNIGSTAAWFNTFYGLSTQAKYADLAEKYTSDAEYAPGTVVVFGGAAEVTTTTEFADSRVAGAVSTDPAYLMNAAIDGVAVALRGRIPVKVIGPVQKGDLLVTSTTPGFAQSVGNDRLYGASIFAKSLETDLSGGEKTIEAVVI